MSLLDNNDLLIKLEQLIDVLQAPKVPPAKALWDTGQCAAYLGVSKKKFTYDIACKKTFPLARNVGDTINSTNYRWVAGEVMTWAEAQKIKH